MCLSKKPVMREAHQEGENGQAESTNTVLVRMLKKAS